MCSVHIDWHQVCDVCCFHTFWLLLSCSDILCHFRISAAQSMGYSLSILVSTHKHRIKQPPIAVFSSLFIPYSCHTRMCSLPLPSGTNVVLWYYIDWIDQLFCCATYYTMILTVVLFFVGMCVYIGGMVDDLKMTLSESQGDSRELFAVIVFHNQLLT